MYCTYSEITRQRAVSRQLSFLHRLVTPRPAKRHARLLFSRENLLG